MLIGTSPAGPALAQLSQLEGELSKVKATIKELDAEVTSLKGERSQAVGILQEIQGKLRVSAGGCCWVGALACDMTVKAFPDGMWPSRLYGSDQGRGAGTVA
jgi:hypothetical protein